MRPRRSGSTRLNREPRRGWTETVLRQRSEIEQLLRNSPSLRGELPDEVQSATIRAKKLVAKTAHLYGETLSRAFDDLTFTPGQVLEDWFPAEP